jgi:hypothetical protein
MEESYIEKESDDIEVLRYKHIILRRLQKTAIGEIDVLEAKNLKLTNDNIKLRKTVQQLSESTANSNNLMIKALTVNNTMKDDYRNRIQALENELAKYK